MVGGGNIFRICVCVFFNTLFFQSWLYDKCCDGECGYIGKALFPLWGACVCMCHITAHAFVRLCVHCVKKNS